MKYIFRCIYWKKNGYCESKHSNNIIKKFNCALTCDLCSEKTNNSTTQIQTTIKPTTKIQKNNNSTKITTIKPTTSTSNTKKASKKDSDNNGKESNEN